MTATIAPEPSVKHGPNPSEQRSRRKSGHSDERKRRQSVRRPVPPIRWRTVPIGGLIAALLCAGLMALLLVNNSLAAGSFERARLKAERTLLFEQEQALNQEVLALSSPTALLSEARRLGMAPAASSAFLDVSTGRILGIPKAARGVVPFVVSEESEVNPGEELGAESSPSTETGEPADQETLGSTDENDVTEGDGARPGPTVVDGREDRAAVVEPSEPGDGAQISSGTAQDRAILSGGGL